MKRAYVFSPDELVLALLYAGKLKQAFKEILNLLKKKEKTKTLERALEVLKARTRFENWILVHKEEPSKKTHGSFHLPNEWKHLIFYNTKTGELICSCPGFVYSGNCHHIGRIKQFFELINESRYSNPPKTKGPQKGMGKH